MYVAFCDKFRGNSHIVAEKKGYSQNMIKNETCQLYYSFIVYKLKFEAMNRTALQYSVPRVPTLMAKQMMQHFHARCRFFIRICRY